MTVTHLLDSPVPNSDSVARIKQVLHNPTAHDAQSKETKVQLAWLDVFLPEDLATGNQVHVQGRTSRPGQGGSVQQVGHSGARFLHGWSVHWTLSSLPFTANCLIKLYNGASGTNLWVLEGSSVFVFNCGRPIFAFLADAEVLEGPDAELSLSAPPSRASLFRDPFSFFTAWVAS